MPNQLNSRKQPWQRPHMGKMWQDMPGNSVDAQKMNFYLFRRGELALTADGRAPGWKEAAKAAKLSQMRRAKAEKEGRNSPQGTPQHTVLVSGYAPIRVPAPMRVESRLKVTQKALRDEAAAAAAAALAPQIFSQGACALAQPKHNGDMKKQPAEDMGRDKKTGRPLKLSRKFDEGLFGGPVLPADAIEEFGNREKVNITPKEASAIKARSAAARLKEELTWPQFHKAANVPVGAFYGICNRARGQVNKRQLHRLLRWLDSVDGLGGLKALDKSRPLGQRPATPAGGRPLGQRPETVPAGADVVTLRKEMFEGVDDPYCKFNPGSEVSADEAGAAAMVENGDKPPVPMPVQWIKTDQHLVPAWIDLETGGLDEDRHPIVEMAAMMPLGPLPGGSCFAIDCDYAWEVAEHGLELDPAAMAVNGALDRPETGARPNRALMALAAFVLGDRMEDWLLGRSLAPIFLCGANPGFDVGFLNATCKRYGFPALARRGLDVQQEAMALLWDGNPPVPRFSSDNISAALELTPEPRPHKALAGVAQAMKIHAEIRRRAGK